MENISIIKFDSRLIGVSEEIYSGYKISWIEKENNNFFNEVLNYLSIDYGEGFVNQNFKTEYRVSFKSKWSLLSKAIIPKLTKCSLVITDDDLFNKVLMKFNLSHIIIDESSTIESMVTDIIKKHLFKLRTKKRIQKIRVDIASMLSAHGSKIQWYNIGLSDYDSSFSVFFNYHNKKYIFSF